MDLERSSNLRILMFPWLAYGHISPYLNVAKKFVDRGFYVYLCSTPINLNHIKKKVPQKYSFSIQLVELHLPDLPELPPNYHTTNGLPPHLNSTLKKALKMSKPNFSRILENLKPDLLIYDTLQPWADEVAHSHNIPAVKLLTTTAAFLSYVLNLMKNPDQVEPPFPAINYSTKIEKQRVDKLMAAAKEKDPDEDKEFFSSERNMQIVLISTSKAIEAKYIDYLKTLKVYRKVVPIGALVQDRHINEDEDGDMELIDWLGKKDENSTVFVSFGSEYFLSKEDLEEIAIGLERSNVNFIWVVRFPKGEEIKLEEALPVNFLERIRDKGKVVNGWAPQQRILSHPSIGGFISHCGFNSVMESIDFGVPIIAMPMHLDQPINARLMVEIGVAVEIVRDDEGKIHRKEVAEVIKSVIFEKVGENLRKKARDISQNSKNASEEEMDAAVEELIQICKNSNCLNIM